MTIKVRQINIEKGMPTVEKAMRDMLNGLTTAKMSGATAAIIIHGWGSSGVGGRIKAAVSSKLGSPEMRGIVRDHVKGENWQLKKHDFLDVCPALKEFARDIDGNPGVTAVLLRR